MTQPFPNSFHRIDINLRCVLRAGFSFITNIIKERRLGGGEGGGSGSLCGTHTSIPQKAHVLHICHPSWSWADGKNGGLKVFGSFVSSVCV